MTKTLKILFGWTCLLIVNYCNSQVVIKGHIYDSLHNKIILFEPINGFNNNQVGRPEWEIKTDKNNYFKRIVNLSKPNMLTFQIGLRPVWIFAEPKDTIDIIIDANKFTNNSPNGGITIKGRNGKGNEYFNYFNYLPGKKIGDYEFYADDSLKFRRTHDFKAIDFALAKVTGNFDVLLHEKQITKIFYYLVVPGIKALLVSMEVRYLLVAQSKLPYDKAVEFAAEIYKRYPVTEEIIKSSVFGWLIASKYYKILASTGRTEDFHDSTFFSNGKRIIINSNFIYWLSAPKNIQEVLWPLSLINLKKLFADHYSTRDIDAFLTLHPNSPVKQYLQPPYFQTYETVNTAVDSSLIKMVSDTVSIKFADVLQKNFTGKKLFVDFWATWCAPCKQEFEYNNAVDSFCNKYNISRLYVSFDEPGMYNTMYKNIYAYNLKGYHTKVSKPLFIDIKNTFYPGKEEFFIPRYLLVNESGEIINAEAPRPSTGNELFNAMKRAFKFIN